MLSRWLATIVVTEALAPNAHFLAEFALDPQVRVGGDSGKPIALVTEGEPFIKMAKAPVARTQEVSQDTGRKIHISD